MHKINLLLRNVHRLLSILSQAFRSPSQPKHAQELIEALGELAVNRPQVLVLAKLPYQVRLLLCERCWNLHLVMYNNIATKLFAAHAQAVEDLRIVRLCAWHNLLKMRSF